MLVLRRFSALGSFAAVAIAAGLLTTDPRPAAGQTVEFEVGKTLYENPLSGPEDIEGWILESSEIGFQICSLRKTTVHDDGPIMQRRPDPLPSARDATRPYRMQAIKYGPYFRLTIDDMVVIDWKDDGAPDSVLAGGKIGFRQMAGLIADYGNLTVQEVVIKKSESYSAR